MLTKAFVATLLALASASPIDLVAHPIIPMVPRQDGIVIAEANIGVYICSQAHWGGRCDWEPVTSGLCHPYNLGTSSSFGPDHGATCALYTGKNCDGIAMQNVVWPGFAEGLFASVQSWKCEE